MGRRAGALLFRFRLNSRWFNNQVGFANKIGIPKSLISMLEKGQRHLRYAHLEAIENANVFTKSQLEELRSEAVYEWVEAEFGTSVAKRYVVLLEPLEFALQGFQQQRRQGFLTKESIGFLKVSISQLQSLKAQYHTDTRRIDRLIAKYLVEYLDALTEVLQPEQVKGSVQIWGYLDHLASIRETLQETDLEDYDQALVLPALMHHVAGNFDRAFAMMKELAEPGQLYSSRALGLSVRGILSILAVRTLKGYSVKDAYSEFRITESIAQEALANRIIDREAKAQVLEVLGMGKGLLGLPDPLSDIEMALTYLAEAREAGQAPRKIAIAQIRRSDFLVRLQNKESNIDLLRQSAERGLKLFEQSGYERYAGQVIQPLRTSKDVKLRELAEYLQKHPWQTTED